MSMSKKQRRGKARAWHRVPIWTICIAGVGLVAGCTWIGRGARCIAGPRATESLFGIATVSPPTAIPFEQMKDEFVVDTKAMNFDKALEASKDFQSVGIRRREVQRRAGVTGSADLLQLAMIAAQMSAGVPPTNVGTPPPTPTPNLAGTDFANLPTGGTPPVVGLGHRLQSAFNNVVQARLLGASSTVYSKLQKEYDIKFVFNQLTVIPGTKTENNSHAEIRTLWTIDDDKGKGTGADDKDLIVIPIFPTLDGVGELNESASRDQTLLYLMATLQAGPAQATPEAQQLITDMRQLLSATQRVTLLGSSTSNGNVTYRVNGERTALPFTEKRPQGTRQMQPLTLPMVTIVMLRKSRFAEQPVGVKMSYTTRWVREAAVLSKIPPENLIPGLLYDRGTRFKDPSKTANTVASKAYNAPTAAARTYDSKAIRFKASETELVTPLIITGLAEDNIYNPLDQVLLVSTIGSSAVEFYIDNVPLASKRVKAETATTASFPHPDTGLGLAASGPRMMESNSAHVARYSFDPGDNPVDEPSPAATPAVDSTLKAEINREALRSYSTFKAGEPTIATGKLIGAVKEMTRMAVITPKLIKKVTSREWTAAQAAQVAATLTIALWDDRETTKTEALWKSRDTEEQKKMEAEAEKSGKKPEPKIKLTPLEELTAEGFNAFSKLPVETYQVLIPTEVLRNVNEHRHYANLSAVNAIGPAYESITVDLTSLHSDQPLAPLTDTIKSVQRTTDGITGKKSETELEFTAPRGSYWPAEALEIIDPIPEPIIEH